MIYTIIICLSSFGSLNVKTFTTGRLTQAAAQSGYLPMLLKTVARDIDIDESRLQGKSRASFASFLRKPARVGDGSAPVSVSNHYMHTRLRDELTN